MRTMLSVKIWVLSTLAVVVLLMDNLGGGVTGDPKSCKAIMSEMTKKQLKGITMCVKSMKFKNSKDKAAKMTCILKCVLINEGILNTNGHLEVEEMVKSLEDRAPPILKEKVRELMGGCGEKHAGTLDPKDEFCKSYDPLVKCFMAAFMEMCPQ